MYSNAIAEKGSQLFYLCFFIWFVANGVLYIEIPQTDLFILINHCRGLPADFFFTGITFLGNGMVIIPAGLICLLYKRRDLGIGMIFSFVLTGIVTILLKHHFNYPRPAAYFSGSTLVRTASWIPLYYKHSFPSGHTASVFAAAITISLFASRKRWVSGICFLFACLTAYSRVYLGEHFVEDVWIGSLEGVVFGTICFLLQQKILYVLRKKEHKLEGYNSQNIEF